MSPEFELIAKFFTRTAKNAVLGVGDDCALIGVSPGYELAVSTDTLVVGTHFFPGADPEKLGHKALAVNLSDLAAMGAAPRFVMLALTLPSVDHDWLGAFSQGFFSLADRFGVELIGGDITQGPLSMTLTVFGEVAAGRALRRDGARHGDDIWVSGEVGSAALALRHLRGEICLDTKGFEACAERLHKPVPRIELGRALVGLASSAIDISDGLVADLTHICERSGLSANISWPSVPLAAHLVSMDLSMKMACALAGGDDYELCFTAPDVSRNDVERAGVSCAVPLTRIGAMCNGEPRAHVRDERGEEVAMKSAGFDHFTRQN